MPAMDALHMKVRMYDDWASGTGTKLFEGWLQSNNDNPPSAMASRGIKNLYQRFTETTTAEALRAQIEAAEAFYCTDSMMGLVEHTAATMPNDGVERPELPAEAGFLWLPRSLPHFDIRGKRMQTRAFLWFQFEGALAIIFLTDRDDPDDQVTRNIIETHNYPQAEWALTPKLQTQHLMILGYGNPLPTFPDTSAMHRWRKLLPKVEFVPFYTDDAVGWDIGGDPNEVHHAKTLMALNPPQEKNEHITGFLVAFWRLCGQTLARVEKEPLDRPTKRRLQARHMQLNPVTVITLRHSGQSRDDDPNHPGYDHRFIRRGHWRRVWCGPMTGERYQRSVWIHKTIVGPEDKPLIVREHVNSLSR